MAANAGWPTLAGRNVFDSRLGPTDLSSPAPAPMIMISTDETEREDRDLMTPGGAPEMVALGVEILVPAVVETESGAPAAVPVETDALAEATLDLMGAQIRHRLDWSRTDGLLHHVVIAIEKIEDRGWRDADTDIRVTARRLEFKAAVRRDGEWPASGSGIARLPSPLRDVAGALPVGSHGRSVAEVVAALMIAPEIYTHLAEMRLAANLTRAAGETEPPAPDASGATPTGDLGGSITYP